MVWQYGHIVATVKMTFSLDEATARRLGEVAEALRKPKSRVVRDAIADYAERMSRLTEEKRRMLDVLDALTATEPSRSAVETDAELEDLRRARRLGGRSREGDV